MLPYVYRKAIFPKSLYAIVCKTWKTNNSEVIEFLKKDTLTLPSSVWYINPLHIIN